MAEEYRFQARYRMPAQGRGPIAVRREIEFTAIWGHPGADLAIETSSHLSPPLLITAHFPPFQGASSLV
jgi:hypothetical protein